MQLATKIVYSGSEFSKQQPSVGGILSIVYSLLEGHSIDVESDCLTAFSESLCLVVSLHSQLPTLKHNNY